MQCENSAPTQPSITHQDLRSVQCHSPRLWHTERQHRGFLDALDGAQKPSHQCTQAFASMYAAPGPLRRNIFFGTDLGGATDWGSEDSPSGLSIKFFVCVYVCCSLAQCGLIIQGCEMFSENFCTMCALRMLALYIVLLHHLGTSTAITARIQLAVPISLNSTAYVILVATMAPTYAMRSAYKGATESGIAVAAGTTCEPHFGDARFHCTHGHGACMRFIACLYLRSLFYSVSCYP